MIEIDPNVRCENNWTFVPQADCPDVRFGYAYVAVEPESGLTFPCSVARIDEAKGIVYLDVAWEKGRPR